VSGIRFQGLRSKGKAGNRKGRKTKDGRLEGKKVRYRRAKGKGKIGSKLNAERNKD
jgi:hypothetical protein